ncbi:MAG: helix-turn-helix transcriptional regulator [Oscillospiraceae bacterium]|nr:helix-turn-helix transcriptional regulator [Oscillospiraceae bacterium]
MCGRLKKIRKTIKLTQAQFAASLGLGQSTYAMMEVGKRDILDRHVKTICALYNISEEWFKTGEGEMFRTPYASFVQELSAKYNVDETIKNFISAYLELDAHDRGVISDFISRISTLCAAAPARKRPYTLKEDKEDTSDDAGILSTADSVSSDNDL